MFYIPRIVAEFFYFKPQISGISQMQISSASESIRLICVICVRKKLTTDIRDNTDFNHGIYLDLASRHREKVYLLPLEGVRGVEPSLWEGRVRLFFSPKYLAVSKILYTFALVQNSKPLSPKRLT